MRNFKTQVHFIAQINLGNTPLHEAILLYMKSGSETNKNVVETLLRNGASLEIANHENLMPFDLPSTKNMLSEFEHIVNFM